MNDSEPQVPPVFSIEEADAPEGVLLLAVSGELDLATSGRFRGHIDTAVANRVRLLIVDLAEVSFIESTMLRELLRARDELAAAGARFVIVGAGAPVLRLLDLTGTTGLFTFAQSRAEALAA